MKKYVMYLLMLVLVVMPHILADDGQNANIDTTISADEKMLGIALLAKLDGHKIIKGRILTGDQFFTEADKKKSTYLMDELKGDCIEMEGAAVAQVCTVNEVPHLIIRTVSDKADGTAVQDYNKFTPIVANNSFKIVEHVVKNL